MSGSLIKVWPWKEIVGEKLDYPILPTTYANVTQSSAQLIESIVFAIVGIAIVLGIELFATKGKSK